MAKGILHLHLTVNILFLLFFGFKTILLLINNYSLLDKIREKTKVLDMILGTLILLTGAYLVFATRNTETYIIGKIVLVLLAIPLGIVGLKRKNKILASISLLIFIYVYGVAETKSLKFKRDKFILPNTSTTNTPDTKADTAVAQIMNANEKNGLNNTKAIYDQLCMRCHGVDGKLALAGAKDLTKSKLNDNEKEKIIANGKALMPAFKNDLSEQEIKLMVNYVNTLKK